MAASTARSTAAVRRRADRPRAAHRSSLDARARIAELDVAFVLGAVDDSRLDGIARYGVWRFCFGADGAHGETFAGLREVAAGEPLTASGIKVRMRPTARRASPTSRGRGPIRSRSVRNRAQLLQKTAEFAFRSLRELHRSGEGWLSAAARCRTGWRRSRSRRIGDLSRIVGRVATRGLDRALHIEQWFFLAYKFGKEGAARTSPASRASCRQGPRLGRSRS